MSTWRSGTQYITSMWKQKSFWDLFRRFLCYQSAINSFCIALLERLVPGIVSSALELQYRAKLVLKVKCKFSFSRNQTHKPFIFRWFGHIHSSMSDFTFDLTSFILIFGSLFCLFFVIACIYCYCWKKQIDRRLSRLGLR